MKKSILRDICKIVTPKFLTHLSRSLRFNQRTTSQLSGADFVRMLTTQVSSGHDLTYSNLNATLRLINPEIKISNQALAKYLCKDSGVEIMRVSFEKILSFQKEKLSEFKKFDLGAFSFFKRILIQDSTICTLNSKLFHKYKGSGGSASKASLKIDVIHELKSSKLIKISLLPGNQPDNKASHSILEEVQENDLVIRDLGYSKLEVFAQMNAQKISFISRLHPTLTVYLSPKDKLPTDIIKHLSRKYKNHSIIDADIYIGNKKEKFRMIAYKVSEEVSNERRRKVRRTAVSQGRTASDGLLARCDYVILITNVPKEHLEAKIIGTIYRIRWSIELMFKVWKSQLNLQTSLKGHKEACIECYIYAILIIALLTVTVHGWLRMMEIEKKGNEISLDRLARWLIDMKIYPTLLWGRIERLEKALLDDHRHIMKQKRKRKTTVRRILDQEAYGDKYVVNF
jgi:hypothetical protein